MQVVELWWVIIRLVMSVVGLTAAGCKALGTARTVKSMDASYAMVENLTGTDRERSNLFSDYLKAYSGKRKRAEVWGREYMA